MQPQGFPLGWGCVPPIFAEKPMGRRERPTVYSPEQLCTITLRSPFLWMRGPSPGGPASHVWSYPCIIGILVEQHHFAEAVRGGPREEAQPLC